MSYRSNSEWIPSSEPGTETEDESRENVVLSVGVLQSVSLDDFIKFSLLIFAYSHILV